MPPRFRPLNMAQHSVTSPTADQLITPTVTAGGTMGTLAPVTLSHGLSRTVMHRPNGTVVSRIMQANYVIEDLSKLSPDKFGFSEENLIT